MHGQLCHSRTRVSRETAAESAAPAPVRRSPDDRVSEQERETAGTLLTNAFRDGAISMGEFETGLSDAFAARTVADLEAAKCTVPAAYADELRRAELQRQAAAVRAAKRKEEVRSYLRLMALLLGIWLAVGVAAGAWYPWPIWPALGWGIPLFAGGRHGRHGRRDYDLRHGSFRTDSG